MPSFFFSVPSFFFAVSGVVSFCEGWRPVVSRDANPHGMASAIFAIRSGRSAVEGDGTGQGGGHDGDRRCGGAGLEVFIRLVMIAVIYKYCIYPSI